MYPISRKEPARRNNVPIDRLAAAFSVIPRSEKLLHAVVMLFLDDRSPLDRLPLFDNGGTRAIAVPIVIAMAVADGEPTPTGPTPTPPPPLPRFRSSRGLWSIQ